MANKKNGPVELVKPADIIVENREVGLDILHDHPRNYNSHNRNIKGLVRSLQRFGQVRSIVVWRNPDDDLLYILAGHGVAQAAKQLGWKTIRADVVDSCDEVTALAYVVADNEHARDSDPDRAALALIIDEVSQYDADLAEAMSFDEDKYAALLAELEAGIDGYGDGAGGAGAGSGAGGGGAGGESGPPDVKFKEYDESVANDVEMCTCPKCGHNFPL